MFGYVWAVIHALFGGGGSTSRGGAGGVGKMCFSAGVDFLQIISNVPEELQVDKEIDGTMRKAMNAKEWVQYVLDNFAKASLPPFLPLIDSIALNSTRASNASLCLEGVSRSRS